MVKFCIKNILYCSLGFMLCANAMGDRSPNEIITEGSESEIITLLSNGFDPNTQIEHADEKGSVLHWAATKGYTKVFEWVKHNSKNPNFYSLGFDDKTPLHWAIFFDQLKIIEWYAINHLDLNSTQNGASVPIKYAVKENKLSAFKYLLILGVIPPPKIIINGRTWVGENENKTYYYYTSGSRDNTSQLLNCCLQLTTCIRTIARSNDKLGKLQALKLIEKEKIKQKIKNNEECDTGEYENCCVELFYLMPQFPKQHEELGKAISRFKDLIERHAEIDAPENELRADVPLHALIYQPIHGVSLSLLQLTCWLIKKKKANVNALNLEGYTPLALACICPNRLLVRLFLLNGANFNIGPNPLLLSLANHTQNAIFPLFENILYGLSMLEKQSKQQP